MDKKIPYTIAMKDTITASGTLEFTYRAPQNQSVEVMGMLLFPQAACSLIRIQVDGNIVYGNLSTADPIPSTELPQSNTDIRAVNLFRVPLFIAGGSTLTLEFLDTSAANNLVSIFLEAVMNMP